MASCRVWVVSRRSAGARRQPTRRKAGESDAERPEVAPVRVSPAVLGVSELSVRVGGIYAVLNAGLEVRTGEVVGLIGPNGAGKTTLIDAITGFVRPSQGRVELNGGDVTRWPVARRKHAGVSRTFQSLELFEDVSVRDNLLAGSDDLGIRPYLTDIFWPRPRISLPPRPRRFRSWISSRCSTSRPATSRTGSGGW